MLSLDKLPLGMTQYIESINCSGILKTRLLDLGLVDGTPITPLFKSPLGDPTAYEFRGSIIAIRDDEARQIMLKK